MKDLKYLAALSIPLSAIISIYFKGYLSYFTPVYTFVIIPLLEIILPIDTSNLEEESINSKIKNKIFDWMLYINVPIVFALLFYTHWDISTYNYEIYELIGITFSVGIVLGVNGINVAHELGHRQKTIERYPGKLLLLPSYYMHFYIEHNFGHHAHAATKEDPATAKYNQSLYSFWFTSTFRQYINAWKIQKKLQSSNGNSFFSAKNDMFYYLIFQTIFILFVYQQFGKLGILFSLSAGIIGFLLLETVNYIEHYGLVRFKMPSGRYERVRECHSWNSNHVVGRIVLYELTRHSDHHYKSSKKYQTLDYHDISPQMPYGYPTSMVLSFFPPLWFNIMNKRVPKEMRQNITS